jgi:protein-disulfide isomerase
MNQNLHSDDEILAGVQRRLSKVEPFIPQPAEPNASFADAGPVRGGVVVHSRVGLAGFAPLMLVAGLVVVAVGFGLASRPWGNSPAGAGPSTTIIYQAVTSTGTPVGTAMSGADLDTIVSILKRRLESTGVSGSEVTPIPPDEVSVKIYGATDVSTIQSLLGATGQLSFVLLPPDTYGTADTPGSKPVPSVGEAIDPTLPAQFTGRQLDGSQVSASLDSNSNQWVVNFAFAGLAAADFETWSGQHVNDYFAIVLDGKVVSAPYLKSQVAGGKGQVGGNFTADSARQLATILQYGAFPYPLREVSVTTDPGTVAIIAAPTVAVPDDTLPAGTATSGRTIGDANAPVTIDVWVDYQCPLCAVLDHDTMPQVIAAYVEPGKARIVFHDFIVIDGNTGGHESLDAANAARCAADQGKFATYKAWLFANQGPEGSGAFTKARLVEIAGAAGLDTTTFKTCVDNGTHDAEVQAESASAGSLSLNAMPSVSLSLIGTPSVLVNGKPLSTYAYDDIKAAIDAALLAAAASPPPSPQATTAPVPVESVPMASAGPTQPGTTPTAAVSSAP